MNNKGVRLSILKAYCKEVGQVLDIYQAMNYYFSQKEPRKRLNFFCSDKACRKQNHTKIIAVNYDKLSMEDGEKFIRAHYREHYKFHHIPECEWMLRAIANEEVKSELDIKPGAVSAGNRHKQRKTSDVVNYFSPATTEQPLSGGQPVTQSDVRKPVDRRRRINRFKEEIRRNLNRSHALHEVVTCFIELDYSERNKETLHIAGCGSRSYADSFVQVSRVYPGMQCRIIYGGASVKRYGTNFSIRFFDKVFPQIERRQSTHRLSLYVTQEEIVNYHYNGTLRSILDKAAGNPECYYLKCFFWGRVVLAGNDRKVCSVHLDSLDDLVVILKEKPRK